MRSSSASSSYQSGIAGDPSSNAQAAAGVRAWQPVAIVPAFHQLQSAREGGAILVLDGAMGTELEARGAPMDDHAWCGLANLMQPALVRAIHEDHIRAGADVVITNTY